MGTVHILERQASVRPPEPWDGKRRLRFMFLRTSVHDYTTAYSHELIDEMSDLGLLNEIDWDYDPGPPGPLVETRADLIEVSWGMLQRVRAASESGDYDAIVIQGFLDPILYPAREVARVPVLGCCNSALHIASLLGHRSAILDTLECMAIPIRENTRLYDLSHKVASVRSIEFPVREVLRKERLPELLDAMAVQARAAVEDDGADTLIMGCTALSWLVPHMRRRLVDVGLNVPLVEPIHAAVTLATGLVQMRLNHSRVAYPSNEAKKSAVPR